MSKSPWTDPDPQPGDFDADIERMNPRDIRVVEAGAEPMIVVRVENRDVDEWGDLRALTEFASGETMRRLAEEERAAGFPPWEYIRRKCAARLPQADR